MITKEELYQAFMKFCDERKLPSVGKKAFGHKIKKIYYVSEERENWRGIGLKSESGEENDESTGDSGGESEDKETNTDAH